MEMDSNIIYFDRESRYKWFWNIVEKSERKPEKLLSILEELPRRKIMFFQEAFDNYYYVTLETDPENYEQLGKTAYKAVVDKCYDARGIPYPDAIVTQWTWDIIRKAENSTEKMTEILMGMTKDKIYWFYKEISEAALLLTCPIFSNYWLIGSEDATEDVSFEIVSQGEEYYLYMLQNPKKFPRTRNDNIANYQYIPIKVFKEKFQDAVREYEDAYWYGTEENQ